MHKMAATTEQLAVQLADAMPALGQREQHVVLALYRLLAEGKPVSPERLAERAALPLEQIERLLESWPGVYLDEGRVIGFWGLALAQMPHRLQVDGRELRAWCAWDTLFLPELIGSPARVESECPTTGEPISLEVVPGRGALNPAPATAVLSFLRPDKPFDSKMVMSFCHFVHFFRDEAAAREWTARHEQTFTLSIDDGFEIGRFANRRKFGAALSGDQLAARSL